VRDRRVKTEAPRATNDAIAARIATAGFAPPPPTSAAAAAAPPPLAVITHRARLHVPRAILEILRRDPGLVAPAVEAFFARDPIDMRLCKKMVRRVPACPPACLPACLVHLRLHRWASAFPSWPRVKATLLFSVGGGLPRFASG
jgi:hypothetical protein